MFHTCETKIIYFETKVVQEKQTVADSQTEQHISTAYMLTCLLATHLIGAALIFQLVQTTGLRH